MDLPRFVEFRDLDGGYALVRPLDEVRARVLSSNRMSRGELLYKPASLAWGEAAFDLGGYTRLSLEEMTGGEPEEQGGLESDDLQNDLDILEDAHRKVDRRAGSCPRRMAEHQAPPEWADLEPEPDGMLLRLAVHYRLRHERKGGRTPQFEVCRCSRYAPRQDLALAWFHELTYWGLRERRLPSLARMLRALAGASFRVLKREQEERAAG